MTNKTNTTRNLDRACTRGPSAALAMRCSAGPAAALLMLLALTAAAAAQAVPASQPAQPAAAQAPRVPLISEGSGADGKLVLMAAKSAVLNTRLPYKRVSVGQPEVADVNPIGPQSILLTAKKPGTTQLIVWDDADRSQVVDVTVNADVQGLREQLQSMFPDTRIEVSGLSGALALRGRVASLEAAEQAMQVASPYAPRVLNFLEVAGGRQVMLQVRFAEVSRSAISALGVNFGFTDGHSFFGSNIGQVSPLGIKEAAGNAAELAVQAPNPAVTMFGKGEVGNTAFAYFLNALRQNNLLRVLAEPNLVAISGQQASFLAGGDYPIPVAQSGAGGNTAITVEYRDFGVRLDFVPMVLGDGRIRLKLTPEVSDVDYTNAVRANGFLIPGRRTRKVTSTIELADGQTFAVAGLLDNRVVASKDVTPGLGDVPVLGALFRSVRYQRNETELVVLVTPRLVEGMNPAAVPQLPGETWRHPDEGELFLKQDLGGPAAAPKGGGQAAATTRPATFRGQYGFAPADEGPKPAK